MSQQLAVPRNGGHAAAGWDASFRPPILILAGVPEVAAMTGRLREDATLED